ncbi:MAG: alginate O-acetyltransferase AlgF [Stagnimonas sp.]|nr:alginate O-acetyltransferase AlgF [Stagnimonas sp.]
MTQLPMRAHRSHPFKRRLPVMVGLLILLLASWSSRLRAGGDEGLYGAAAPPGSAFVRVFNATPQTLEGIRVGDQTLDELAPQAASDFVFLPAGSPDLSAGGASLSLSLVSGRYYTVVREPRGFTVLDNARHGNRLKALVLFYNLTDGKALGLKTADGSAAVVDGVQPASYGAREVNAIRAQLAVYDGSSKVADARPMGLERGRAYSLFATGPASAPQLTWVVN